MVTISLVVVLQAKLMINCKRRYRALHIVEVDTIDLNTLLSPHQKYEST